MEAPSVPLVAGLVASGLFVSSHVPMLVKAFRTRDVRSYSLANLVLTNVGNGVYWLYVVTLPVGPLWLLHSFYTVVMALMLVWYLRQTVPRRDNLSHALDAPAHPRRR